MCVGGRRGREKEGTKERGEQRRAVCGCQTPARKSKDEKGREDFLEEDKEGRACVAVAGRSPWILSAAAASDLE